jgi:hypothetical protein
MEPESMIRWSNQRKMSATSEQPWKPQSQDLTYTWDQMIGLDTNLTPIPAFDTTTVEPLPTSLHRRVSPLRGKQYLDAKV